MGWKEIVMVLWELWVQTRLETNEQHEGFKRREREGEDLGFESRRRKGCEGVCFIRVLNEFSLRVDEVKVMIEESSRVLIPLERCLVGR